MLKFELLAVFIGGKPRPPWHDPGKHKANKCNVMNTGHLNGPRNENVCQIPTLMQIKYYFDKEKLSHNKLLERNKQK